MNFKKVLVILSLLFFTLPLFSVPSYAESGTEEKISFNFVDVDIQSVIKFISEITGKNFLYDNRVKGKITIITPTRLSVDESFRLFTSVLSLKGFTIIPAGHKTFKIIPRSLAKQEGLISGEGDAPVNEAYITRLIQTEHIKAEDTVNFLRPVVSRDGHISAFGPTNLLLVVDSAMNIEKITSILKLIDKPEIREEDADEEINVYFLENADAVELAKVLQEIIKDLNRSLAPKKRASASPQIVSVTPDKTTNSLVIVSTPSTYKNILNVIKTLDKRRKQVYVEAMIVEASIDKLKDIGAQWRAAARSEGEIVGIGGFGNISTSAMQSIVTGLTGTSIGGMGNFLDVPVTTINSDGTFSSQTLTAPGYAALFSLNQFEGAVNVLSTPQILTSDNEEAEIVVGENVPFISKRERDLTTTNTVLSSIERTDVGITLRITPQVTEGDYVKLNIFQEISAVKDASDEILTTVGPSTTKRSTRTSVSVKNGSTVVIGGLMQEREEEGINKTPLLGDIPGLGWLFKSKSKTKSKVNLLVFLSPHIVKDSRDLSQITDYKQKKFIEEEKFYRDGEVLVRFADDVTGNAALAVISENGASVIEHYKKLNVYRVKIRSGQEVEEALGEFTSLPEVLYAEPNYKFTIQSELLNINSAGD